MGRQDPERPNVFYVNREELLARRAEILDILRLTYKEWLAVVMNEAYQGEQWTYRDEMDGIDFLLGDDEDED